MPTFKVIRHSSPTDRPNQTQLRSPTDQSDENAENQRLQHFKDFMRQRLKWNTSVSTVKTSAKRLLIRAFWMIFIIWLAYLTLKMCKDLIVDYLDEPRMTVFEKEVENNKYIVPMATLCLPLTAGEIDSGPQSSNDTEYYQRSVLAFFNPINFPKKRTLSEETVWPRPVLYIIHQYLTWMNYYQRMDDESESELSAKLKETADSQKAIQIFQSKLFNEYKIQSYLFNERFGNEMKKLLGLTGTCYIYRDIFWSMNNVDYDQICFSMISMNHSVGYAIDITANKMQLFRNPSSKHQFAYMDFGASARVRLGETDLGGVLPLSFNGNHKGSLRAEVRSVSLHTRKGIPQCNATGEKDGTSALYHQKCLADCLQDYMKTACNCWPHYWNSYFDHLENICSLDEYKMGKCLNKTNYRINYAPLCEKRCRPPCDRTLVRIQTLPQRPEDYIEGSLQIRLSFPFAPLFVIFKETLVWSPVYSIMNALSGVLRLWLGLNFLVVMRLITTAMAYLYSTIVWCKQRLRSENQAITPDDSNQVIEMQNSDCILRNSLTENEEVSEKCNEKSQHNERVRRHNSPLSAPSSQTENLSRKETWSYFKNVVWGVTRTLLFCSCMFLCFQTIKIYKDDHKKSKIDAKMQFHDAMTLPMITICLTLDSGEFDDSHLSKDSNKELFNYLNRTDLTRDIFLKESWPNQVLREIHFYLQQIQYFDLTTYHERLNPNYGVGDRLPRYSTLETKLTGLNITLDEVRQKFGRLAASALSFNIKYNGNEVKDMSTYFESGELYTKFVYYSETCYELKLDQGILRSADDAIIISFSEWTLQRQYSTGSKRLPAVFDFTNRYYFDYVLLQHYYDSRQFTINFGEHVDVIIDIDSVSYANPDLTDCSPTLTSSENASYCRINRTLERCGCLPSTWHKLLGPFGGIGNCSLKVYDTCARSNWTASSCNDYTDNDAINACEQRTYTSKSTVLSDSNNVTIVNLRMDPSNYMEYTQRYTDKLEEGLIGDLSNVIALCLGLSFVASIQLLVSFLVVTATFIFQKWNGNSEPNTDNEGVVVEDEHAMSNSFQHLVLQCKRFRLSLRNVTPISAIKFFIPKAFWCAVYGFFGYRTIIMGIEFTGQYLEQPTTLSASFQFNELISLPDATACLSLVPEDLDELQRPDFINFSIKWWYTEDPIDYNIKIQEYFDLLTTIDCSLTENYPPFSRAMLHITHVYLALLTLIESHDMRGAVDFIKISANFMSTSNKDPDLTLPVMMLENKLLERGISVYDWKQLFGHEVAKAYSFHASHLSSFGGTFEIDANINIDLVGTVSTKNICYRLPFSKFPLQRNQVLEVSARRHSPSIGSDSWNQKMTVAFSSACMDMAGMESCNINGQLIETNFTTLKQAIVVLQGVYRSFPTAKGQVRCSESNSYAACATDCKIRRIESLYSCHPSSWPMLRPKRSEVKDCRLENYSNCPGFAVNDDNENCVENCLKQCERWDFSSQEMSLFDDYARIQLFVSALGYPLIEERHEWTAEQLAAKIGSILVLYLGLDFLRVARFLSKAVSLLIDIVQYFNSRMWKESQ